ncbi:MAG: dipeptide epimerase [Rhodobacteraceae bacterium]|nr:dipeptide epimerase [Paracoccaceae bacterium]
MKITAQPETFPLKGVFTIARGAKTHAQVLCVQVEKEGVVGRGECLPYARYGESMQTVMAQMASLPADFTGAELQELLPAGAARNGVDCAMWDWAAKKAGKRVWELAGLAPPKPCDTAYTISLDTPQNMHAQAVQNAHFPLLKVKLGTAEDVPRLEAVRAGAPRAQIIVDANEGWSERIYSDLMPDLQRLGVGLIEQPLPAAQDEALRRLPRPIPVCADESCHDRQSLPALVGKYDIVNIKLDKTGGLSEALLLREAAQARGFGIMVGCMVGSSLAMAPAVLVAQGAMITDLDGPLWLKSDRQPALTFDKQGLHPPCAALWG